MRKLIKSVSLSILLGVAFIGAAWAQTFNAAVNRTEVPQGETFVLTLELADGSDSGNPDLSVLDKDFIVYSVGNAFSYNYINGVASKSRQWQIALMPKNSGKITVPSIKLGNLETQPITLNVIPASAAATEASAGTGGYQAPQQMNRPKFSMTAEIGNPNPYVQQQVDYTLKIYDTGGLQGDMPQFIEDGSNNWIIRSLGEPIVGSKIVNGRSLREITFRYALFPQKSGVLPTPEVRFNGYYLTRSRGMNDPLTICSAATSAVSASSTCLPPVTRFCSRPNPKKLMFSRFPRTITAIGGFRHNKWLFLPNGNPGSRSLKSAKRSTGQFT